MAIERHQFGGQVTNALVDSSAGILLAYSFHVSGIVFLNECTIDTRHVTSVDYPNYGEDFFLNSAPPEEYPKWSWDRTERKFIETRVDLLTGAMVSKSRLAMAKLTVIARMMNSLNVARYKIRTGVEFQDYVFAAKRIQALKFQELGYDEDHASEYPFVTQYADYAGLSLQHAAESILLKARFSDDLLAKTEFLRLKYFNAVKAETNSELLPGILKEFQQDCFSNTQV